MLIVPLPAVLLDFFDHGQHLGGAGDRWSRRVRPARARVLVVPVAAAADDAVPPGAQRVASTRLILLDGRRRRASIHAFGDFVVGGNLVVGVVIFLILDRDPVRGHHERRRAASPRSPRASPSTRCPASRWRSTPTCNAGPDRPRTRPAAAARELAPGGRLLRRDGRRHQVRQGRRRSRASSSSSINIVGGLTIGVVQQGMPAGRRRQHFTLLTIGDGLVRPDPGAADLDRRRHHRDPLGARETDLGRDVTDAAARPARRRRWSPASW